LGEGVDDDAVDPLAYRPRSPGCSSYQHSLTPCWTSRMSRILQDNDSSAVTTHKG
jgi:hypothetical protein